MNKRYSNDNRFLAAGFLLLALGLLLLSLSLSGCKRKTELEASARSDNQADAAAADSAGIDWNAWWERYMSARSDAASNVRLRFGSQPVAPQPTRVDTIYRTTNHCDPDTLPVYERNITGRIILGPEGVQVQLKATCPDVECPTLEELDVSGTSSGSTTTTDTLAQHQRSYRKGYIAGQAEAAANCEVKADCPPPPATWWIWVVGIAIGLALGALTGYAAAFGLNPLTAIKRLFT